VLTRKNNVSVLHFVTSNVRYVFAVLQIRVRAPKIDQVHLGFLQMNVVEHVLVYVIVFETLQLFVAFQANHLAEFPTTVVVVGLIIWSEQNIVHFNVKMHISQLVKFFDAVYHLDAHF
jgi:hypothetical protein